MCTPPKVRDQQGKSRLLESKKGLTGATCHEFQKIALLRWSESSKDVPEPFHDRLVRMVSSAAPGNQRVARERRGQRTVIARPKKKISPSKLPKVVDVDRSLLTANDHLQFSRILESCRYRQNVGFKLHEQENETTYKHANPVNWNEVVESP